MNAADAYAPWTADADMYAIRDEHERRQQMIDDWREDRSESKRHRGRSALVASLVGACLVAIMVVLGAIAWAS